MRQTSERVQFNAGNSCRRVTVSLGLGARGPPLAHSRHDTADEALPDPAAPSDVICDAGALAAANVQSLAIRALAREHPLCRLHCRARTVVYDASPLDRALADERTMQRRRGFTMLELMAVVAVVAILATLALPSYLDRIVREQVKLALPLADIAKQPIAGYWSLNQAFPADNAAVGLPPADKIVGNYVSSLSVKDGAIDITFGNRVNKAISGKVLSLRPAVVEDAPIVPVAWVCGNAEAPGKMTVSGENRTDIPDALLPVECRASSR